MTKGATHSEDGRSAQATVHQESSIPRAHTGEECVALFCGSYVPEGEALWPTMVWVDRSPTDECMPYFIKRPGNASPLRPGHEEVVICLA